MAAGWDSAAVEAVEAALVDAGVRVATAAQDLTPPCAYLLWWSNEAGAGVLSGAYPVVVAVHWVPIRGPQDTYAEADAAATVTEAVREVAELSVGNRSTVTVGESVTWPCLRWEATVHP